MTTSAQNLDEVAKYVAGLSKDEVIKRLGFAVAGTGDNIKEAEKAINTFTTVASATHGVSALALLDAEMEDTGQNFFDKRKAELKEFVCCKSVQDVVQKVGGGISAALIAKIVGVLTASAALAGLGLLVLAYIAYLIITGGINKYCGWPS